MLREQLREKAVEMEAREAAVREKQEQDEQYFVEHTAPALRLAAAYFRDVVRDLEIVCPVVAASYPLGPASRPEVLLEQSGYRMFVDNTDMPKQLSVNGTCEIPSPISRTVHSLREADEFEQLLRDMGVTHHRRRQNKISDIQAEASRFIIEGEIQAGFSLTADFPGQRVRIDIKNLEDRPQRVYFLAPERVDESLCDALGRVLLREQTQLLSTEVHEERRQLLREDVLKLQRKREMELAAGLAEQKALEEKRREQSLKGVAQKKIKGVKNQIADRIKKVLRPE